MNKIMVLFAALVLVVMSGCADPVVFAEVFQLEKGQEIYTRYNLWYDDPEEVSCLNIQSGAFIPIGSVIEPIGTDSFPERIRFRDRKSGKVFAIRFEEAYRLCTMRDFIAMTFSSENPLASIPEKSEQEKKIKARIVRGEVVPGMTRRDVELAYGPPPAIRTPDKRNESWIYWRTPTQQIRVVFRDDVVRSIINTDAGL
ncbi:MAG: hypothetical protein IKC89_05620 [Lentisphaeria bacterium]|nr:hypothetical protein [Lentisphaeria bacterium]